MKAAKALPVLMYHHISPSPGLVTMAPELFRRQMAAVAKAGWRTAGLREVEAFLRGEPIPDRTCVITFDDGYLDNYVHAYPVLKEFGLKAVLFLVTGWPGDGPVRTGPQETPDHNECKRRIAAGDADSVIVRWSEAALMQESGVFEIHSHTHGHVRWDQTVPDLARRREGLADDLRRSRQTLAERLGGFSTHLCWPQGYFDPDYLDVARREGFTHFHTTRRHLNLPSTPADDIGRLAVKDRSDEAWITGRLALYSRPFLGRLYTCLRGGE